VALKGIPYQPDYRSGWDNILDDFYRRSLREAKRYWRAVGYFSSSALEAFGSALGDFVMTDGTIRLITSVELSESDLRAIEAGERKQDVCARRLEEIIEAEFGEGVGKGTARLSWLLQLDRLEIRIAVPKTGTGIYHEKIGVFFDEPDYVAFTGSSNESRNALENNRECIDCFTSWDLPERAARKRRHFEDLWNGNDQGVEVYTFPDAARQHLIRVSQERAPAPSAEPSSDQRWRHQLEAMERFLASERGVLNMATGTGKTRTALNILASLYDRQEINTVIVTTDGNDLLTQWYSELLRLRRQLSSPARIYRDYSGFSDFEEFNLDPHGGILLVSRDASTTRDPLASALRRLSHKQRRRTLLIHDEVHRLGSAGNRRRLEGLSDGIRFRLGLSATPEREYDADGNSFIEAHIGPVLMTFELGDAIHRGILAPFRYYPLPYELFEEDHQRLRDVYRKKAARAAVGEPMSEEEVWTQLARVYKTSRAKLPVFQRFSETNQDILERCIVFVETQSYGHEVLDIVHTYRPDFHTYFTGEEDATLRRFARGELECLVTCHRLSEGIDIHSLNSVVLFSSARARLETIQRMGRCLRTDPANPSKVANVVDFVRTDSGGNLLAPDNERAAWLTALSNTRPE
jgi:superfamily II DNA or RNA helicase